MENARQIKKIKNRKIELLKVFKTSRRHDVETTSVHFTE